MAKVWTIIAIGVLLAGAVSAAATPYWFDWEGLDWPENQGWSRSWGNWNGSHQGGAVRTLEDGILTYDSLYDDGVYDYSYMRRPGQMDPGQSEQLVIEWALKVDTVTGYAGYDPGVAFSSDERWCLGLVYGEDWIHSDFENATIFFTPGVRHAYRLVSSDVRTYDLYIDSELARQGVFVHLASLSDVEWGDFVQGAASLHHWDYFRYGVIAPEPATMLLLMWVTAWRGVRRG